MRGEGGAHVAATLFGKQEAPRIVGIDEHIVDLPPSRHMLVVHNEDVPGVIGKVATILGDAGINISDMDVGASPSGAAALMAIATDTLVPPDVDRADHRAARRAVGARDRSRVDEISAWRRAGRRPPPQPAST